MQAKSQSYLFWETALSAYWESNLSVKAYCREHNLPYKTACYWRRRFLRGDDFTSTEIGFSGKHDDNYEFVPVSLSDTVSDLSFTSSGITIEISGAFVHLGKDFDDASLLRVINLLGGNR